MQSMFIIEHFTSVGNNIKNISSTSLHIIAICSKNAHKQLFYLKVLIGAFIINI